jgi:hypothetical protein
LEKKFIHLVAPRAHSAELAEAHDRGIPEHSGIEKEISSKCMFVDMRNPRISGDL